MGLNLLNVKIDPQVTVALEKIESTLNITEALGMVHAFNSSTAKL